MRAWPARVARVARVARAIAAVLVAASAGDAAAQEFSRYLACAGSFTSQGRTRDANADFALRVNNRTALIQSSNVLPVGEALVYVPTPANYSMTYLLPRKGNKVLVVPGWFANTILVSYPNLERLNQIRMSIDRQTGVLDGRLLNEEDELLGAFTMRCTSKSEEAVGAPKF